MKLRLASDGSTNSRSDSAALRTGGGLETLILTRERRCRVFGFLALVAPLFRENSLQNSDSRRPGVRI